MRKQVIILLIIIISEINTINCDHNFGFVLKDLLRSPVTKEKRIIQVANRNGYAIEEHFVTTSDGYIIKMHRIPPYGKRKRGPKRSSVYIVHGLLQSSDTWLVSGIGKSLSYLLADAGYDVWMANCRGSFHSRRHRKLNVNTHAFWEFSWHEIGVYDHPANIDYILNKTNDRSLHYIGHSQGTTSFFVMTSLRPEYNAKIKTMHALSPVVFMSHVRSPVFRVPSYFLNSISNLARNFGLKEFAPNTHLVEKIAKMLCQTNVPLKNLCGNILFITGGFNPKQFNTSLASDIFATTPSGSSTYQFTHYLQAVLSGHFRMFDRGKLKNMVTYGQINPPDYPLQRVSAPLYLYYSKNDLISAVEDVEILLRKLKSVAGTTLVADPLWSHFDYIWGIQAKELVYDLVLGTMNEFEQRNAIRIR